MKIHFKMPPNLKSILYLFLMALFFFGCEKDNEKEINSVEDFEPPFRIVKVGVSKIQENKTLIRKLSKVNTKKEQSKTIASKTVKSKKYDFTIIKDQAIFIENKEKTYHSYTFPVIRKNSIPNTLENLVVSLQPDNEYLMLLVVYERKNNEESFDKVTSMSKIEDDELQSDLFGKQYSNCVTVMRPGCSCGVHNDETGYEECSAACYMEYRTDYCASSGGISGTAEHTVYIYDIGGNNGGTGGSNSGTGTAINLTQPIAFEVVNVINCIQQSNPHIYSATQWLSNHPQEATKIDGYLESNGGCNSVNEAFINLVVEDLIDDETLEFEALVELLNGMDKDCQALIFYKSILKVNSTFTNLIKNSYLALNKPNISFLDIAVGEGEPALISSEGARTQPYLGTNEAGESTVIIEFNNDYLDQATDLGLVNTLYHELLHAHILNLYHGGELLTKYPTYTSLNTALDNYYSDDENVIFGEEYKQEMHNIYVDFIDILAESLVEYATTHNIIGVDLDYAKKLVWGGLKGYNVFTNNLTTAEQNEAQTLLGKENFNHSDAKSSKTCN